MVLLAIDAITSTGTVALFQGERLLGEASVPMRGATEERLMPAVLQLVLRHASWGAVDRIAVGGGPGSFTSLRIAASIGKGLAHACGVALWSVPSLPLTVAQDPDLAPGRYVATLDAMRGEYYVSIVDVARDGSIGLGDVAVARVPVSSIAEYTRTAGGVARPRGSRRSSATATSSVATSSRGGIARSGGARTTPSPAAQPTTCTARITRWSGKKPPARPAWTTTACATAP